MFKGILCKTINIPILVTLWHNHIMEYYTAVNEIDLDLNKL